MSDLNKKEKKRGIRIALPIILLAAVAVAGGLYLWRNMSGKAINEAIENEDIESVTELYDRISDEDKKEEVRVSMIERARELRDAYIAEEATYDEVMDEFALLKDNVLDDSEEFEEINEQIERIDISRRSYKKGQKEYDKARYAEAVKCYKEVISEDEKYYKLAAEGIDECNEAVKDMVEGTWSYEYDAHVEVEQYVKQKGFDVDLSKMKIPIVFLFKLDREGSIDVSVDYDALNEYIDKVLDLAVDAMSKGIEKEGLNIPGLSGMLKQVTQATGIKDKVKKELNIQAELDRLLKDSGLDKFDSFRVEDGHLYIGTACIDVSLNDDELTLTSEGSSALGVGSYKMPYPIRMTRREDKDETVSGNTVSGNSTVSGNKADDKPDKKPVSGNGIDTKKPVSGNSTDKKKEINIRPAVKPEKKPNGMDNDEPMVP
ncbi:MAG: hypothetical protein IK111_08525 [Lachnospiraceae bacterium]|nr:hypothetical protein [Lachnospiraceae bacterium]